MHLRIELNLFKATYNREWLRYRVNRRQKCSLLNGVTVRVKWVKVGR